MTSETRTAVVVGLDLDPDGTLLVRARCQDCGRTVMHGAGRDVDAPVLGTRTAHCRCREDEPGAVYTLIDPHDVIRLRLRVIRPEAAERAALEAERGALRATHRANLREARLRRSAARWGSR
jgi:hypothetical protein